MLTGVRVLDLADERAVFAGRLLADLGAEVLRVEHAEDRVRSRSPFLEGVALPEASAYHQYHNINKRSVVLDRRTAAGRAEIASLASTVDILIESDLPGVLDGEGLGYQELSAANPGLIYISVTPYGQDSVRRQWKGNDLTAIASGGLAFVSGAADGPPVQPAAHQAYKMAGLAAATASLIALAGRKDSARTRGVHIDISLQEVVSMAVIQTSNPNRWAWHGQIPRRPGMSNVFETRDGKWTTLNVRPDKFREFLQWLKECGVATSLTPDDWGVARVDGEKSGRSLAPLIRELIGLHERDSFQQEAWKRGLVTLPLNTLSDLLTCDHMIETDQFVEVESKASTESLSVPRSPVAALAGVELRAAPLLGGGGADTSTPRRTANPSQPFPLAKPLEGIRVLDFCWVLAGPLGTRLLANFGAEVIRVESHARIDTPRTSLRPPSSQSLDAGGMHNAVNTCKRSLTLDLKNPGARDVALRLAAISDVVTNNFTPGTMERLGLGYDDLKRVNPRIVNLSMPGCGNKGPWADKGTLGNIILAASGLSSITGFPGTPPYGIGVAYPDFTSPYLLAMLALAGIRKRDATGEGQDINLSQLSATVSLIGERWLEFAASGLEPERNRNRDPDYSPHGVYPARGDDEWCALAVEGDEEWRALCELMGRPELAVSPAFETHQARKANEDELEAVVARWTRTRSKADLSDALQAVGIAAAPVLNLKEMVEDDPAMANHYQALTQPDVPGFTVLVDKDPIRFRGFDRVLTRAPMMGEHNEATVQGLLGMSEAEYDALIMSGALN